jgi:hypothetical protein
VNKRTLELSTPIETQTKYLQVRNLAGGKVVLAGKISVANTL